MDDSLFNKVTGKKKAKITIPTFEPLLSPFEREALKKTGWEEEQPVPKDWQERIKAFIKKDENEILSEDPNDFVLDKPKKNPISDNPQKEINVTDYQQYFSDAEEKTRKLIELKEQEQNKEETKEEAHEPQTFKDGHICKYCGWDQRNDVVPELTEEQKIAFLHSFLAGVPYQEQVPTVQDKLFLTIRTLENYEIQEIYKDIDIFYTKQNKEKTKPTETEVLEKFYFYRSYLQIIKAVIPDQNKTVFHLPNSLEHWEGFLKQKKLWQEDQTRLENIFNYCQRYVYRTESVARKYMGLVNEFNRRVIRLETCLENDDFLSETA